MRQCKDCKAEERKGPILNAPYPGPRCYRHHLARRRKLKAKATQDRRAKTYALHPEDAKRIWKAQGEGCGWCGRPIRNGGRQPAIDHDHACCPGKQTCGACTRGMLCWFCNRALEHFHDNPELIERGAEYLRNPPAQKIALQPSLL